MDFYLYNSSFASINLSVCLSVLDWWPAPPLLILLTLGQKYSSLIYKRFVPHLPLSLLTVYFITLTVARVWSVNKKKHLTGPAVLNGHSNWPGVVRRRSWGFFPKAGSREKELIGDSFAEYQRGNRGRRRGRGSRARFSLKTHASIPLLTVQTNCIMVLE